MDLDAEVLSKPGDATHDFCEPFTRREVALAKRGVAHEGKEAVEKA